MVRFPVLSQIARITKFSLIYSLGLPKMTTYDDPPCPLMFPGRPDPVFCPKSGFSKTIYLKFIHLEKFFRTNFFSDTTCPGSGFAVNCPVSHIFYKPLFRHTQSHDLSWSPISLMFPDVRIRFSKDPFWLLFHYLVCFSIIWFDIKLIT